MPCVSNWTRSSGIGWRPIRIYKENDFVAAFVKTRICPPIHIGGPGNMFDELNDLYQQVILDHCKQPRNFHEMPAATRRAQGHNPLCGDQLKLFLALDGDTIKDISF